MRNNTYLFITTYVERANQFQIQTSCYFSIGRACTPMRTRHFNGRSNCERINTRQCVCYCNNVRGSILLGAL